MAILETPAGFEPNSGRVAEQVAHFVEKRLQDFAPAITVIPAPARRKAATVPTTGLATQLHDANVIFMGPGSPTYAVRQLQESTRMGDGACLPAPGRDGGVLERNDAGGQPGPCRSTRSTRQAATCTGRRAGLFCRVRAGAIPCFPLEQC
ncbi:MAG: hypothetical protein U0X20_07340 [Caldilineaceae bacterium]